MISGRSNSQARGGIFYGWKIVAALFVILTFTAGLGFYNHSVLLSALVNERGFPVAVASSAVSLFFLVSGVSGLVIGALLEKHDVRIIITTGALLASLSLFSLACVSEIWQLYLAYFVFGIGFSASGILPATTLVARWFNRGRARALSVASTGLSIGGVVITPLSAVLVDERGIVGASPWLAILFILGVVPACLIILRSSPASIGLEMDGAGAAGEKTSSEDGMTLGDAMGQGYFWTLSISFLFVMLAQVGGIAHQYGAISQHLSPADTAYAIAIVPLLSMLGRLAGGILIDIFSTSRVTVFMMLLQSIAFATIAFAPNASLLILGLVLFGITVGNLLMLQPLLIAEVYGLVHYGRIFSWSNLITIFGISTGPSLMGFLSAKDPSYFLSFMVASVSGLVACAIFIAGTRPLMSDSQR